MIGFQNQVPLKSLTPRSSLVMLLRALYRIGLNYCVLPPTGEHAYVIVFTKDQLVSLIERSSSEVFISEIPKRVAQGLFKPVAIFKPDSSSSDFVSHGGFAEPERLQVLLVEEDGAKVLPLKEALAPRVPDFPEWWEAPVPFAMYGYGKLHVNHTAMLMFGPDLKRMSIDDIPDKNEFLVTLEGGESRCSVTFRRLEGDIFVLEDSTSDIIAAEEVAWWAAIGKAWAAVLDQEKRDYMRCGEEEAQALHTEETLVLPCEWEGELLGYFCVSGKPGPADKPAAASKKSEKSEKSKEIPKTEKVKKAEKAGKAGKAGKKQAVAPRPAPKNDALSILGPQAMGLLAPGMSFPAAESESEKPENEQGKEPVKKPVKGPVKRPAKQGKK